MDHLKTEIEKYQSLKPYVGNEVFEKIYDYYVNDIHTGSQLTQFLEFNMMLDKHRKTNFNHTFPELSCLI